WLSRSPVTRNRGIPGCLTLPAGQPAGQFGAAAYAQLAVRAAEVELHRFRAEVKLAADLPVGEAVGREDGDPQLGFGSFQAGPRPRRQHRPAGPQFTWGSPRPGDRAVLLEDLQCRAELAAGRPPLALAAQPLAVQQPGAGHDE